MKLFVASFSLVCFCILFSTEAKADGSYCGARFFRLHQTDQGLGNAQPAMHTRYSADSHGNRYLAFGYAVTDQLPLFFSQIGPQTAFAAFTAVGAKDFYIHTGLSPPAFFI